MSEEPARIQIQRIIRDAVMAAPAYRVYYENGEATINPDAPETVAPGGAEVNETRTAWQPSRIQNDFRQEQDTWSFEALVKYPCEVELQSVEAALAGIGDVRLYTEESSRYPTRSILFYLGAEIEHPTREARSGTKVRFQFSVKNKP